MEKAEVLKKLGNLAKAFAELSSIWSEFTEDVDFIAEDYPFNMSFDELSCEVAEWNDFHQEQFKADNNVTS